MECSVAEFWDEIYGQMGSVPNMKLPDLNSFAEHSYATLGVWRCPQGQVPLLVFLTNISEGLPAVHLPRYQRLSIAGAPPEEWDSSDPWAQQLGVAKSELDWYLARAGAPVGGGSPSKCAGYAASIGSKHSDSALLCELLRAGRVAVLQASPVGCRSAKKTNTPPGSATGAKVLRSYISSVRVHGEKEGEGYFYKTPVRRFIDQDLHAACGDPERCPLFVLLSGKVHWDLMPWFKAASAHEPKKVFNTVKCGDVPPFCAARHGQSSVDRALRALRPALLEAAAALDQRGGALPAAPAPADRPGQMVQPAPLPLPPLPQQQEGGKQQGEGGAKQPLSLLCEQQGPEAAQEAAAASVAQGPCATAAGGSRACLDGRGSGNTQRASGGAERASSGSKRSSGTAGVSSGGRSAKRPRVQTKGAVTPYKQGQSPGSSQGQVGCSTAAAADPSPASVPAPPAAAEPGGPATPAAGAVPPAAATLATPTQQELQGQQAPAEGAAPLQQQQEQPLPHQGQAPADPAPQTQTRQQSVGGAEGLGQPVRPQGQQREQQEQQEPEGRGGAVAPAAAEPQSAQVPAGGPDLLAQLAALPFNAAALAAGISEELVGGFVGAHAMGFTPGQREEARGVLLRWLEGGAFAAARELMKRMTQ